MAFILIIVGIVLFLTAVKGTTGALGSLLTQDIFGPHGFIYWALAVLVIGAVGYIRPLKALSNSFLVLLILVLFISQRGFFAKFNQAIGIIDTNAQTQQPAATPVYAGTNGALG